MADDGVGRDGQHLLRRAERDRHANKQPRPQLAVRVGELGDQRHRVRLRRHLPSQIANAGLDLTAGQRRHLDAYLLTRGQVERSPILLADVRGRPQHPRVGQDEDRVGSFHPFCRSEIPLFDRAREGRTDFDPRQPVALRLLHRHRVGRVAQQQRELLLRDVESAERIAGLDFGHTDFAGRVECRLLARRLERRFRAPAFGLSFGERRLRQHATTGRLGPFRKLFGEQVARIGRDQHIATLAQRLAAKPFFQLVCRHTALEPVDERGDVGTDLPLPIMFLGRQLPILVAVMHLRAGRAHFRTAEDAEHLPRPHVIARRDADLGQDAVGGRANVDVASLVVPQPSGHDVQHLQRLNGGRLHSELQRGQLLLVERDGRALGRFGFVLLLGLVSGLRRLQPTGNRRGRGRHHQHGGDRQRDADFHL